MAYNHPDFRHVMRAIGYEAVDQRYDAYSDNFRLTVMINGADIRKAAFGNNDSMLDKIAGTIDREVSFKALRLWYAKRPKPRLCAGLRRK